MEQKSAFELEIAKVIVESLNLDMDPEQIDPEMPLVQDGLGLDSIDFLELTMEIQKRYKVELGSAGADQTIFSSLRSLSKFIDSKITN